MSDLRHRTAALVAAAALGLGVAPFAGLVAPASAAPDACATQQTQYDRAVAKKASLDAKLAKLTTDVRDARAELKAADTAKERRSARAEIATARAKKTKVRSAKKYQLQRIEKAAARLEQCRKANPAPVVPSPGA